MTFTKGDHTMTCIAYRLSSGERCPDPVGASSTAQQLKLCRQHSHAGFLVFLASAQQCELIAMQEWDRVIPSEEPRDIMLRELRDACAAFPPAVVEEVLLTAGSVQPGGTTLDDYLARVFAATIPILQAYLDVRQAEVNEQVQATDAYIADSDRRIAALYVLRDWKVPSTTTH